MQEVYWEKIPVKNKGEGTGGDMVSFQTTMQACTCKRIWEKKEGWMEELQMAVKCQDSFGQANGNSLSPSQPKALLVCSSYTDIPVSMVATVETTTLFSL